jgi:uncharacterized protein YbbK (DUF523 family)
MLFTMDRSRVEKAIGAWPQFTSEQPLRVIVSGCLTGRPCGVDVSSYGDHPMARALLGLPNVRAFDFCPGDFALGRPRFRPSIIGGDGFDVLDGRARVRTDDGSDWTEAMIFAAYRMADLARHHAVHLALVADLSAACGAQVIENGPRRLRTYRAGPGVATALLERRGVAVVSEKDWPTLALVFVRLGRPDLVPPEALELSAGPLSIAR